MMPFRTPMFTQAGGLVIFPEPQLVVDDGDSPTILPRPEPLPPGALMLGMLWRNSGPFHQPGGWDEVYDDGDGHAHYAKSAGDSEPNDYTFTTGSQYLSTSPSIGTIISVVGGAYAENISDREREEGGIVAIPSITMSKAGLLIAVLWSCTSYNESTRSFSTSDGMQSIIHDARNEVSMHVFAQYVPAGATGPRTFTRSGGSATGSFGYMFGVVPAS